MSRHAQVALAGAQGLSLFDYSSTDPILTLSASVPIASSAVVFHSDGSRFLTISSDGLQVSVFTRGGLKLYDVKRTGPETSLPVTAALFHAGGVLIAAGGTARLYSTSGSLSATLGGHPPSATIVALSTNADDTLIASAAGTSLIIHNRATNTQNALHAKPSKVTYSALAFAPHRRTFLAAGTSTGLLHLFDTTKPSAPLRTIALCSSPLPPPVTNIAFSATSSALLIACTSTGQLSLIDTEKLKVVVSMEIGVPVEKGKMSLGPDGRTALFAGKGVVLVLDIKSRKGIKEVPIENGGWLGGITFAPGPSKKPTLAASHTSSAHPASSVLTESINRMRAGLSSNSSAKEPPVSNKLLVAPQLEGIDEVFSAPRFSRSSGQDFDLPPDDLPSSKQDFAASIAREARTSTLRAPCSSSSSALRASQTPANTSSLSDPSPELPSFAPGSDLPLHHRRPASSSSGSLRSGNSTRAGSPATSVGRSEGEVTLGAVTRGLRLPEMEEEAERGQAPLPKEKERTKKIKVARVGAEELAKAGPKVGLKVSAPSEREAPQDAEVALMKEGSRRVARRKVVDEDEGGARAEHAENESQGQAAGGGTDVLKSAVREVMDEYCAKTSREIQNLHLELIRQTFAQKTEIKTLMERHYGDELKQLREENARLREENARLRNQY